MFKDPNNFIYVHILQIKTKFLEIYFFQNYTMGSNTAPELVLSEDPDSHILNVIFNIIQVAIGRSMMLIIAPALNQAVQNLERSIPHFIILRLRAVVNHFT